MKLKITITLTYDGIPLDAPILAFIDDQYLKTLYTVNGNVEEIIDVEGNYITAIFEETDDYEESYDKKPLSGACRPASFRPYFLWEER